MFRRKIGLVALAAGAALIALMTLLPQPGQEELVRATPPTCLVCGELGGVDVLLNVILFLPFGLGLGLLGLPWPAVLAAGLGTSGVVEFLQMEVVPGRDASLSDLITNSTGALLGASLGRHWRPLLLPGGRAAARLAGAWALLWLGLALGTGAGLEPAPTAADWYGQWAPDLAHLDRFEGEILSAEAGGAPLNAGRWADRTAWAERVAGDSFAVAATIRTGPPTGRLASIVSVFDGNQTEVFLLGQWGTDLVYRIRMGPARLRLRNPAVRLPGALALPPGTEVRVLGGMSGGGYVIGVESPSGSHRRTVPFSPQWSWALLLPFDYALGPEAGVLTALWLAGLLLPLGWWAGMAAGPWKWALPVVVVVGVAGIRAILGFAPAPASEWLGAGGGAALGAALAGVAARLNKSASLR